MKVDLKVYGKNLCGLIDTGTQINLASMSVMNELKEKGNDLRIIPVCLRIQRLGHNK